MPILENARPGTKHLNWTDFDVFFAIFCNFCYIAVSFLSNKALGLGQCPPKTATEAQGCWGDFLKFKQKRVPLQYGASCLVVAINKGKVKMLTGISARLDFQDLLFFVFHCIQAKDTLIQYILPSFLSFQTLK